MSKIPFRITSVLGNTIGRPSFLRTPNFQDKEVQIETINQDGSRVVISQPYITLLSALFLALIGWIATESSKERRFNFEDVDFGFLVQIDNGVVTYKNLDGTIILSANYWDCLKDVFETMKMEILEAVSQGRLSKDQAIPIIMYNMPFYLQEV